MQRCRCALGALIYGRNRFGTGLTVNRKRSSRDTGESLQFGGEWTTAKLDVVAEYLASYTTALKNTPFRKGYIDAFAGTGYRAERRSKTGPSSQSLLFPDLAKRETQGLLEGSAVRALKTTPRFDSYVFIERSPARCKQLEKLRLQFPELANSIEIRRGEANLEIQALCSKNWRLHRAVLFLDPYGMQVEWKTIDAIAKTRAIDLWVLFPLGIGVNRLLTKSGVIPQSWRKRLDLLVGNDEWYEEFYQIVSTPTLFGKPEDQIVKATTDTIGKYFIRRLKSVFAGVADRPKVLLNSANCPLYLLCFAVGNAKGAETGLKIANHLLRKVTQ
jgi:three-Cys-motif partner protein